MNKKLIVRQNSNNDCGAACLLSIMKYYGLNISLDEVCFAVKTDSYGTNAYNIINGSRTFGFDGYGIHYSYEEIINSNISFPIICHVLKDNLYHFIVVYKVNKNNIEIMDPSSNIIKVSKEYFKNIYLNTSLVIYKVRDFNNKSEYININNYIFENLKLYKNTIIKTFIISLIVILLGLVNNYYLLICIDKIIPKYNLYHFIIISIVFIILYLTKNILFFIRNKYIINVQNDLFINMNNNTIRKIFTLPYQYFKSKSTQEVISRINDIKEFKELVSSLLINLSLDILFILFSSILLIIIKKELFIIILIEIILYLIIYLLFKKTNNKNIDNILKYNELYNKCLNDSINSYEIDKNLNLINNTIKILDVKVKSLSFNNKIYESDLNKQLLIKNIIIDIGYLLSIFMSVIYVKNNTLSIGELFLFNSLLYYFIEPIKEILDLNYNFNYLKNIYNRIISLHMIKSDKDIYFEREMKEDIIIKNLSYKINMDYIIKNINLKIKYKDKILIYGSSGNGKSTLMKIILKYINDYEGNIYFNNINLKDISSNNISYNFTYVSQNSYLIKDTIKNNIIYNRSISDKLYNNIINICNLNHLIDNKIERDNYVIEDNGFNISGGERQKIILARSLLKNSNYIILDEALSEVDLDEEIKIIKKLFDIYKDKTIIYISHKKELINIFKQKYQIERRKVYDK